MPSSTDDGKAARALAEPARAPAKAGHPREMLEKSVVETADAWGTQALSAERPSAGRASELASTDIPLDLSA